MHSLSYNEGTGHRDGSSPTIGHDLSKLCRDVSMSGYCVGINMQDSKTAPFLIDYVTNHILCYDIECEFAGNAYCTYDSPILCVCLLCSCGYSICVSRQTLTGNHIHRVVRDNNRVDIVASTVIKHVMSQYFKQVMCSNASII